MKTSRDIVFLVVWEGDVNKEYIFTSEEYSNMMDIYNESGKIKNKQLKQIHVQYKEYINAF